jgi:L-alanine-DL-glutamate epimerase-like enolase superfamily enzyme
MSSALPRITRIETIGLYRPGGRAAVRNTDTLVRVHTDAGLVGRGSCYTTAPLVQAALEVLEPLLLGEIAIEPERVAEKLHQSTYWQGRGSSVTHAISGVDIALWDILGQHTGQPIGRLLGAATGSASSPTPRSSSTSRGACGRSFARRRPAASGPSSWAGGPSAGGTTPTTSC